MNENHDAPPFETDFVQTTKIKKPPADFTLEDFFGRVRGGAGPTRKWKNPLVVDVSFECHVDPITVAETNDCALCVRAVRFRPGEVRTLPVALDRAIRRTNNGKICGGLAPMLEPLGTCDHLEIADGIREGFAHLIGDSK